MIFVLLKRFIDRIRPAYGVGGFVVRVGVDVLSLNIGYFLSYLLSIFYFIWVGDSISAEDVTVLLKENWLSSASLVSVMGFLVLFSSGLYSRGPASGRHYRFFLALRGVITIFILYVFLGGGLLPEIVPAPTTVFHSQVVGWSAVVVGWLVAGGLIVGIRVLRSVYYQSYITMPRQDVRGLPKAFQGLSGMFGELHYVSESDVDTTNLISPRFAAWPFFDEADIRVVQEVLRSRKVNRWTGTQNVAFEEAFASYCGAQYGIALANGTLAIELALYGLDIGPGDEVIVPCRTFIASASAVVMRGATPVIVDVDPDSQVLSPETVQGALTERTRAVICVHLNGWACDMDGLMDLTRERGIFLIEDCAQAHGARYKGRSVGSLGHVAAFSFCQDKIMTTGGEGGMVLTDDTDLWKKMWAYKDHGKSYDAVFHTEHPSGFRWLHHSFGTNWRMTEMQAALGCEMLKKLPAWIETRRGHAAILVNRLRDIPSLRVPLPPEHIHHAYYKFYAFVEEGALAEGWSRDRIMAEILQRGVPCFTGICGQIQNEQAFAHCPQTGQSFASAERLMDSSLMFLVHPTLTAEDMEQAAEVIASVAREACAACAP